jgi:hypothetical protein
MMMKSANNRSCAGPTVLLLTEEGMLLGTAVKLHLKSKRNGRTGEKSNWKAADWLPLRLLRGAHCRSV